MKKDIKKLIENQIENNLNIKNFALIIGLSPSTGARSPKLWNRAYKSINRSCKMFPADVTKKKLFKLMGLLKKEKDFVGTSVTIPYKENVIKNLNYVNNYAAKIGSVNIIKNRNGKLEGYNTDCTGSLLSLKKISKNKFKQKILILGCGGAGKAVIISTLFFFKKSTLYLYNRKLAKLNKFKKIKSSNSIKLIKNLNQIKKIKNLNLIINTTSIGFDMWIKEKNKFSNQIFFSPLAKIKNLKYASKKNYESFKRLNNKLINENNFESKKILLQNRKATIFDIIYSPKTTILLKQSKLLNMRYLNGEFMNLMQAVEGFCIVNSFKFKNKIQKIMEKNG